MATASAHQRKGTFAIGLLAGAMAVLLLLGVTGRVAVYTGTYDVAASEEHTALGRCTLDTNFQRFAEAAAVEYQPPAHLAAMVEHLAEAAVGRKKSSGSIKHGVKMTGMPAFGALMTTEHFGPLPYWAGSCPP